MRFHLWTDKDDKQKFCGIDANLRFVSLTIMKGRRSRVQFQVLVGKDFGCHPAVFGVPLDR